MDQTRLELYQKRAKISVCFLPEMSFLVEILFAEHTLLGEIILNEASLGGGPTIFGTLGVSASELM